MIKKILAFAAAIGMISLLAVPALASTSTQTAQVQAAYSGNWSGYVSTSSSGSTSGTYTGVGATWTVPTATASGSLSADATWVGIGGISTNDLIQAGTQAVFQTGSSQPAYSAWYEILPASNVPISMTVNAGDSITASVVQRSTGNWTISLRDNTSGQSYQTNVAYTSSLSSAEWIEEMPSFDAGGFIPLDNFGTVNFTSAWATQNGSNVSIAASGTPTALTMYNSNGTVLATPSALGSDGASFSVARTSAAATTSPSLGGGTGTGHRVHRIGVGVSGFRRGARSHSGSTTTTAPIGTPAGFGGFGGFGITIPMPMQQTSTNQTTTYSLGNGWTVSFGSFRFR